MGRRKMITVHTNLRDDITVIQNIKDAVQKFIWMLEAGHEALEAEQSLQLLGNLLLFCHSVQIFLHHGYTKVPEPLFVQDVASGVWTRVYTRETDSTYQSSQRLIIKIIGTKFFINQGKNFIYILFG